MSGRLQGKVAFIKGAGQGIGRTTALLFAREGAKLALLDRNGDQVAAVAKEVTGQGGAATAVACDIANQTDVIAAVDEAVLKLTEFASPVGCRAARLLWPADRREGERGGGAAQRRRHLRQTFGRRVAGQEQQSRRAVFRDRSARCQVLPGICGGT